MTLQAPPPTAPTCTECGALAKTGGTWGYSTAMYCAPFYDETGRQHVHDRNTHSVSYVCRNDHNFTVTRKGECWCGWPTQEEVA